MGQIKSVGKSKGAAPEQAPPARGHNQPPPDTLEELNAGLLRDQAQLLAKLAKAPKAVGSESAVKAAAALVREIRGLGGRLEAAREEQKAPHLAAGRAVDGFFKGLMKPLDDGQGRLSYAVGVWQDKIEAERRAKAEAEAEAAQVEADRLAKLAKKRGASEDVQLQAAEAGMIAEEAADDAAASSADLVRICDEDGTITRKTEWVCEGVDRAELDLETLRPYFTEEALLKAVRAAIRAEIRELAGAVIVERKSAMVL